MRSFLRKPESTDRHSRPREKSVFSKLMKQVPDGVRDDTIKTYSRRAYRAAQEFR